VRISLLGVGPCAKLEYEATYKALGIVDLRGTGVNGVMIIRRAKKVQFNNRYNKALGLNYPDTDVRLLNSYPASNQYHKEEKTYG